MIIITTTHLAVSREEGETLGDGWVGILGVLIGYNSRGLAVCVLGGGGGGVVQWYLELPQIYQS